MGTFSDIAASKAAGAGAGLQDRVFSNARTALAHARKLMQRGEISKATFAKIEKKLTAKLGPGSGANDLAPYLKNRYPFRRPG